MKPIHNLPQIKQPLIRHNSDVKKPPVKVESKPVHTQTHSSAKTNQNISELSASKNGIETGRLLRNSLEAKLASNKSSSKTPAKPEFPVVHIPAERSERHRGTSPFDTLLATNRKPGEPDRYRAVNPNFIVREGNNNYYKLKVVKDAHYFDSNLKTKSLFKNSDVLIDFTRTKTVKNKNGKMEKLVFAKDKGYVRLAALTDGKGTEIKSMDDLKKSEIFKFPLKTNPIQLYDGIGNPRGIINGDSVRLNDGLQKTINGEKYYYAFSATTSLGAASGWIKADTIRDDAQPKYDRTTIEKNAGKSASGPFLEYQITGGDKQAKDQNGNLKYGYMKDGNFVSFKVLPHSTDKNEAATDYLDRFDGKNRLEHVINLGFNVAGVSNDTLKIDGNTPVFHRASGKGTTAVVNLYEPKDGIKPVGTMKFVYGYVEYPGGKDTKTGQIKTEKKWGWLPLDALKRK